MTEPADRPADRLAARLNRHREFLLLLVLALAFRLMAVLVFRPGGFLGEISTFGYYRLLLSFVNQGFYPLVDFWLEYPPLFPWLLMGIYRLSLLIPAWSEPGTWFYLLLGTFLAAAEAGNLVLFYTIARRLHGQERALRLIWLYAALLIPVLTLFISFDSLALLFLLWTVLLTLDGRAAAAGITVGLGFMTKLTPVVAAPAAWQHLRTWPRRARFLLAAGLVVLLIALPLLLAGPQHLLRSLQSPLTRSAWETVWALADGYYSFGVAGNWDRFDPAHAGAAQYPTRVPWTLVTIGFGLLYLFLFTRRVDWTDRRRVVAFTALTQSLLFLYAKGYSPQFLVMLLPFLILLLPGWRGVVYALLLSALNLVEYPIYFLLLPGESWLLAGTVLLRTLILVVTGVEYAAQVYGWAVPARWWQRLAAAVAVLILVLGLVGAVAGLDAYSQSRYAASPHRPAMEVLQAQATPGASVVTGDLDTYEQLYPFLHRRFHVALVETFDYLPPWQPRLAQEAAGAAGQLWLYAPSDSPLHAALAGQYEPVADYEFDGWRLSGWRTQ